jgi:mono/diheme cytochrome c family protein
MLEGWSRMMRQKRTFFLVLFLLFGGTVSTAQTQTADPAAGEVYAEKVCAQCHAIHPSGLSPELTAPPFRDVANTPGMTDTALRVWLSTSHPTMPNIVVEPQDMDNVIAYILTLKNKPQ